VAIADHSCVALGTGGKGDYQPRNPEHLLLYRTIAGHLETFLARQRQRGRDVPQFIERELREYLSCGILACGFLRLKCESCGKDRLLPLSCKGRAVCPSCCGRRMAETAAHMVDHVFPHAPARQWVLSLPFALRYRLAYDSEMVTAVLQVFIRSLFGFYRRRAQNYGIDQTQSGAVTFIQRFGSAANLNVHFHVICIDGIYAPGRDGKPEFFALRPLENEDVRELVELLAKRLGALITRRCTGTGDADSEDSDRLAREQPWLSEVYAASVCGRLADGGRVAVGGDRVDPEAIDSSSTPRCAAAAGFSLHANVAIPSGDRLRLERLVRYAARPPLSMDRLEELPDGKLRYWFKTPWRNGTNHADFEPLDFIEKLVALIPSPRIHMVRFHGLLGPAAKWRSSIIPQAATGQAASPDTDVPIGKNASNADPTGKQETADPPKAQGRNYTWCELMKRVFAADVLACTHCGGRLRILTAIRPPEITRKILDHLGLPSRPPPMAGAVYQEIPFAFE
jgi:hypothetical protein